MIKKSRLLLFTIASMMLLAFYQIDSTKTKEAWPLLVQKEYDRKINDFISSRKSKCLEEILKDAENYVDSTIISEINIKLLDTLIFPEKPFRPEFPQIITLDDSTIIAPIIK